MNKRKEIQHMEFLKVLKYYKRSVMFVTIAVTLIAMCIAYFSHNVFQAETTIKIHTERETAPKDFMSEALGLDNNDIDHEIDMLTSRWIMTQALENLNLGTRYYEQKYLKSFELYKDAPFVVTSEFLASQVNGLEFVVVPIDKNDFRLILEPSLIAILKSKVYHYFNGDENDNKIVHYNAVHRFGEPIITPWFNMTIRKVHQLREHRYSFTIIPNDMMYKFIAKGLQVSALSKKSIMVLLKFNDTVPLRAKEVVNAIANVYLEEHLNSKTESANKTLYFLDMQLEAINKTLQNSAENLQKYKASNIVIDIGEKAQLTAEKLSTLERERFEVNMELGILENILSYMKTHDDISGIDIGSNQNISSTINGLVLKIQEATTLYKSLLVDYTELHPDVLKENEKLLSLRNTLEQTIKGSIRSLNKRKAILNNMIDTNRKAMSSFPQQERELSQLTRNFMVNEKIYSFLLQKRAETAIVASSTVSETRIVDSALLPDKPIKPNRILIIAIGMFLGFIIGFVWALIRNMLDDTIKSVKDIEALSLMPVYGSIPLLDVNDKIDPFLESLRVVRTNLNFIQTERSSKLITITSSVPTEGKSTIAVELSKVIAQGNKKILLIDLDMRRSTVHSKLKLNNDVGMSTLLAGHSTIDEVLQKSEYGSLHVITAGPVPPNPSELIMSEAFKFTIENLLRKYDYIILDSPPIHVVTDGTILIKMSDMTLFVCKANFSKKEFIENLNDFVSKYDLKKAGVILNGVPMSKRLKYGYEYGYYHSKKKK